MDVIKQFIQVLPKDYSLYGDLNYIYSQCITQNIHLYSSTPTIKKKKEKRSMSWYLLVQGPWEMIQSSNVSAKMVTEVR